MLRVTIMSIIKVGCLVSYDYEFLKISLPRFYNYVDEIYFAVDINRRTWSGDQLTISDDFWGWVKSYDILNKITIYEDEFYLPELTPMECDTRERTLLNQRMGNSDWYIQIDSDEYFLDFKAFVDRLSQIKTAMPTSIYCSVLTLFKRLENGYLVIKDSNETLSFATNNPVYELARNNESNVHIHWSDQVLHQSWARNPEEVLFKLNNWSHKNDFNVGSFYKLWDAMDEFNYYCVSNFHPLHPISWPGLILWNGSIDKILDSGGDTEILGARYTTSVKRKSLFSRLWREIKS